MPHPHLKQVIAQMSPEVRRIWLALQRAIDHPEERSDGAKDDNTGTVGRDQTPAGNRSVQAVVDKA
jgi:hypothetical protein